jgi:hypothetical protein
MTSGGAPAPVMSHSIPLLVSRGLYRAARDSEKACRYAWHTHDEDLRTS